MWSRYSIPFWTAACVLWSVLLAVVSLRAGSVIVDSFQCAGALAGSPGPGILRWPFVGSFMGYDQAWGFHWFGWQWLRSLVLPVVPWSPAVDITLLAVVWGLAAWLVAWRVGKAGGRPVGLAAGLFTLVAPGIPVALQSYRPEVPAALGLLLLFGCWEGGTRGQQILRIALLLVLPSIHPLCVVVPAAWWACGWYLECRRAGPWKAVRRMLPQGMAMAGGLLAFAAWYGLQPHALEQFKSNVASQRLLVEGLGSGYLTFFRWGFGGLGSIPLVLLLAPSFCRGVWILGKTACGCDPGPEGFAAAAVVGALVFNVLGRNPNPLHLVAVIPFAAWLLASLLSAAPGGRIPCLFGGTCVVLAGLFGAYPVRQTFKLLGNEGRSHRSDLARVLAELPPARRVYIPVCLWEAAAQADGGREKYRFSTFPNILTRGERLRYEQEVLSGLEAGDLLVWDPPQEEGGIFNFVTETALRHRLIRAPEQMETWEEIGTTRVQVAYSPNQSREFLIYRKK